MAQMDKQYGAIALVYLAFRDSPEVLNFHQWVKSIGDRSANNLRLSTDPYAGSKASFAGSHKARHDKTMHTFSRWAEGHFCRVQLIFHRAKIYIHTDCCVIFATGISSDEEIEESKTTTGVGRRKKKDLWLLTRDDHGKLILPSCDDTVSLRDKKAILRSFLTYSYRMLYFVLLSLFKYLTLSHRRICRQRQGLHSMGQNS